MASELNYRTFVIANPTAAAGRVGREWNWIERLLETRLPELETAFTEGPGHATLLAREALRAGWEMIVCVGGDGTLNEVVNGFFERPEPEATYEREEGWIRPKQPASPEPIRPQAALGFVPIGTGGDFRRSIGLMGGVRESIEHLDGRSTRPVDVGEMAFVDPAGQLAVRYFLNIASTGFSGRVGEATNRMWKGLGGTTSFLLGSAWAYLNWHNVELEAILDDTRELSGDMFNLIAANGEFFGGGMWVAPGAELDDGAFQIVEMGDLSKSEILTLGTRIYTGRHLANPKNRRYTAERMAARTADPEEDVPVEMDGETPGSLPAYWQIHPRELELKF
jgi:diacylglycerol kinase family enzyme